MPIFFAVSGEKNFAAFRNNSIVDLETRRGSFQIINYFLIRLLEFGKILIFQQAFCYSWVMMFLVFRKLNELIGQLYDARLRLCVTFAEASGISQLSAEFFLYVLNWHNFWDFDKRLRRVRGSKLGVFPPQLGAISTELFVLKNAKLVSNINRISL